VFGFARVMNEKKAGPFYGAGPDRLRSTFDLQRSDGRGEIQRLGFRLIVKNHMPVWHDDRPEDLTKQTGGIWSIQRFSKARLPGLIRA